MEQTRIVERKNGDSWDRTEMKDLSPGDIFRMFEETGEPVEWKGFEWKAIGEPHEVVNENGVRTMGIDIEEILKEEE